jgi:hypothetical protein
LDAAVISAIAMILALGSMFSAFSGIATISRAQADAFASARASALREADESVALLSATASTALGVTDVDVTVTNRGRLAYSQFQQWDVIVSYTNSSGDLAVERAAHATVLSGGAWVVQQLLLDSGLGSPELIDPGIFNPHEELVIRIRLSAEVEPGSTNAVTVVTPGGSGGSVQFSG